jgi:hypothetical protein
VVPDTIAVNSRKVPVSLGNCQNESRGDCFVKSVAEHHRVLIVICRPGKEF